MKRQRFTSRRHGFTILELALSVMVMSTLMVAMGSAVLLASKAIPASDNPASAAIDQSRSLDLLTTDLAEALYFSERTATTLAFTVPDRDGDGNPERIRYAWDGSAGDPLTRQFGSSSPRTVVPSVNSLVFTAATESTSQTLHAGFVDGVEQVVANYLATDPVGSIGPGGGDGVGESFLASMLPADAASWRLTAVETRAKQDGPSSGTLGLQIRAASLDGEPLEAVLAQSTVAESSLGSGTFAWARMVIEAKGLDPLGRYVFVLFNTGAGRAGTFEYQSADVVRSDQALVMGNDETGWTVSPVQSLSYNVYGVPQIPGTPVDFVREHVTAIDISLQGAVALRSRAVVPNAPQIVSRLWQLDFEYDPTGLDVNADDTPDWATGDAAVFDEASLVGGVWVATQTLVSSPAPNLDTPLTLKVRLRDTTQSDASSADILLAIDRDGLLGANLRIRVERTGAAQQTFTLLDRRPIGDRALATMNIDTDGFVEVLAVVMPSQSLINVRIDGEDLGTFEYDRFSTADAARIELSPSGGVGAQFKEITIAVNP